jgi:hypothetical protein
MSRQLLFYEQVVPVSPKRHRDLAVKTGSDYSFARKASSVPVTAAEIPQAAAEYCILFGGKPEEPVPLVILGADEGENLYLGPDGSWNARYIPAFVRRYPFVFSRSEDGRKLTLCVDETFSGCNRVGRGERLFDSDGERTAYLKGVLSFQQAFEDQHRRTQAFGRRLRELGLLAPVKAEILPASGARRLLTGVQAVSRARLKELGPDRLAAMVKSGELELIYLHLHSLAHLRGIGERMVAPDKEAASAPPGKERSGTIH